MVRPVPEKYARSRPVRLPPLQAIDIGCPLRRPLRCGKIRSVCCKLLICGDGQSARSPSKSVKVRSVPIQAIENIGPLSRPPGRPLGSARWSVSH